MKNKTTKERFGLLKSGLRAIFFNKESIEHLGAKSKLIHGIIALLFISFIFSIPTDLVSLLGFAWIFNFFTVLVLFFTVLAIIYILSSFLGTATSFKEFFNSVNITLAYSLLFISTPIFILTYFVFQKILGYSLLSLVLFSLIPYYNYVLFGWGCEIITDCKKNKPIVIALISMTLIFIFHYLLRYIVI